MSRNQSGIPSYHKCKGTLPHERQEPRVHAREIYCGTCIDTHGCQNNFVKKKKKKNATFQGEPRTTGD